MSNELLAEWVQAKQTLEAAKAREIELRKAIVADDSFFDPDKEEGTETFDLGGGYKLKATKKINYSMANKQGETFAALKALSSLGPASQRIAKDLVNFSASLRLSEYKKLDDQERRIIDEVITTRPGSPTLELVEPKE